MILIGAVGIAGSIAGATLKTEISNFYLGLSIGTLIAGTGLFLLLNTSLVIDFSWAKIAVPGLFGGFNKGISGSGFGPIVTTGLVYMKIAGKEAVSVQSFFELFISLAGFVTFLVRGSAVNRDLTLTFSVGVAASAPVAAFIVKKSD